MEARGHGLMELLSTMHSIVMDQRRLECIRGFRMNQTIFMDQKNVILGGIYPEENMRALSFNLDDFGTTDQGLNALSIALNGLSGYYTQINNTLHVLDSSATIYAFDLKTVNLISYVVVVILDEAVHIGIGTRLTLQALQVAVEAHMISARRIRGRGK